MDSLSREKNQRIFGPPSAEKGEGLAGRKPIAGIPRHGRAQKLGQLEEFCATALHLLEGELNPEEPQIKGLF